MQSSKFTIKRGHGKYTTLDKAYSRLIQKIMSTLDDSNKGRWETYNLIMEELLSANEINYFEEIKYRLTDGENPNDVFLDILTRIEDGGNVLWFLKRRIGEYIEEDFFKRFY